MSKSALVSPLLLAVAFACSSDDPSPTGTRPQLAVDCPPPAIVITATPSSSTTIAPNTSGTATFLITDNCTDGVDVSFIASRSGAVVSVGTPSPGLVSLNSNQSATVSVSYSVGAPGSGTVILGSRPTPSQYSGALSVTVSGAGVPFGPFDLFNSSNAVRTPLLGFTLTFDDTSPTNIVTLINQAHSNGIKLVPQMTGGSHSNYLTNGKFDYGKWKARQDLFNTAAIKSAMSQAVSDGTVIFAELMDEPNHAEGTPPVADWGGVMTHALLDSMSRYTKAIFPTLRTGVVVQWDWQQASVYQSVDVLATQYSVTKGDVNTYRTNAVNSAAQQKVALVFSMNIIDGGTRVTGCPEPQTGGPGTSSPNCRMTAAQVQSFGNTLLGEPTACGLTMWRWDDAFMGRTDNQNAFASVRATAAAHAPKSCVKPN